MSLTKNRKKLDSSNPVPETSPYIDDAYVGNRDDLVGQIMGRFESYRKPRLIWDQYIFESIALYIGRHYMQWNPTLQMMVPILPDATFMAQVSSNRIMGKCRAVISRMTSFEPSAQVLPESPSQGDIYGARAAKKLLTNNYYANGYRGTYRKAAAFVVVEGNGWIKTEWDECGGKANVDYKMVPSFEDVAIEANQEGQPFSDEVAEWLNNPTGEYEEFLRRTGPAPDGMKRLPIMQDGAFKMQKSLDEEGNPEIQRIWFNGGIRKTAVGPMSMYYNPTVTDWSDCPDTIQVTYMPVDEAKMTIPNCSDLTEQDEEQNDTNPWKMMLGTTIDKNPYGQQKGIPVYEFNMRSTREFPRGLKVIIVKNKMRVGGPMPVLEGDGLPYSYCKYIEIPGVMNGMSLPMHLKSPQTILNKLLSQYVDHAKNFAVPKVLLRSDTKLTDKLTNSVQAVYWSGSDKPDFINPSAFSPAHRELIEYMAKDIDILSGVNPTAEGNPPPNITSGDMADTVTENDYQVHMPDVDSFAECVADSCSKELRAIQKMAPEEVLIRYIGPNGKMIVDRFKKSILRNNISVVMPPGKMGNMSRAQQMNFLKTIAPMIMNKAIDQKSADRILNKVMDSLLWGESEELVGEMNKQEDYIRDLINDIRNSAKIPDFAPKFMPWHDLDVWKTNIETQLLSSDFTDWPDVCKNRLITLWEQVTLKLQEMQMAAAAQIGAAGPEPPKGPGTPPAQGEEENPVDEQRVPPGERGV